MEAISGLSMTSRKNFYVRISKPPVNEDEQSWKHQDDTALCYGYEFKSTNLGLWTPWSNHILEKPLYDTANFQQKGGTIAWLCVNIPWNSMLHDVMPSCPRKCIKYVKAGHFRNSWQGFVSTVKDRDQLSIILGKEVVSNHDITGDSASTVPPYFS